MTDILLSIFIYLAAAVVAVPISKQLGLGSVLGYLIAGIVIGPVLGLVGDETKQIQHVAEFGVVMMLFLVGLELEPKTLWELRHRLLGLGGLQVGATALLICLCAMAFGIVWQTALAIGLTLSLSSTAIVIQTLNEKGLMKTPGGQSAFSVLLFQDIAVIPMLALMPLMALPELASHGAHGEGHGGDHLLAEAAGWLKALVTLGSIAFIILIGHFAVNPLFRYIAKTELREVFTAFALLLVVGIAVLMSLIGLSPALGTFLAGVVLANSEFRHELESTIEPFKGLLLGLFFITVGAGMDLHLLFNNIYSILGITLGVMAIKFAVLFTLGKLFKLRRMYQWLFALALAQAGEFGFVLLSFVVKNNVVPQAIADKLLLVVALSMMLTPLLFILFDKVIVPRQTEAEREADEIDQQSSVIIAGNGRFGQIINRLLLNCGYNPTVLDLNASAIEMFNKYGVRTFFGDASRPELLEAAKIREAKVLVIAVDNKEKALEIAHFAHQTNPKLKIIARAYDLLHLYDLHRVGAHSIIRETFDGAVLAGRETLEAVGMPSKKAKEVSELYYQRDKQLVTELAELYDPSIPRFQNTKITEKFMTFNEETIELIDELIGKYKSDEFTASETQENELGAEMTRVAPSTE